jgi:hypothetical protein
LAALPLADSLQNLPRANGLRRLHDSPVQHACHYIRTPAAPM